MGARECGRHAPSGEGAPWRAKIRSPVGGWVLVGRRASGSEQHETDLHAKNISVIRRDDRSAVLAPAYDIAMHLHYPTRDPLSALDVNAKTPMSEISAGDVVAEGVRWGLPPGRAQRLVGELLEHLDQALRRYDVAAHPGVRPEALGRGVPVHDDDAE